MDLTIDESQFVSDWNTAKQAIAAIEGLEATYGAATLQVKGIVIELTKELKKALKGGIIGKLEADLLDQFRGQLGQ